MTIELLQSLTSDAKEIQRLKDLLAGLESKKLNYKISAEMSNGMVDTVYQSAFENSPVLKDYWQDALTGFRTLVEQQLREKETRFLKWPLIE